MSPKEKAKELVDKLTLSSNAQDGSWMCSELAKQCALIAVDEMLKITPKYYADEILTPKGSTAVQIPNCTYEYLLQVKNEIEIL